MSAGRVTDIRSFLVGGSRWGWLIVRVETDSGVYGLGEGSLEGREQSVQAVVGELKRYLVGQDPTRIEQHYEVLYRQAVWTGGAVLQSAISAVEMALWDIKGKLLGAPVHELLGGRYREAIKLYANGWWYAGGTPAEVAAAARASVAHGYGGLKFNPFNRQPGFDAHRLDNRILFDDVDYVAAVREAVGPEVDVYLDYNAAFANVGDAVRVTRALESYNISFVEEPIPQENVDEMAYFRRKVDVPVATGERLFTPYAFQQLLDRGGADVVQPDLCHCGGLAAARRIGALAETHYVPVAPHNPHGPIGEAAAVHLAACTPNFLVLEHFEPEPWRASVVGEPYRIADGWLEVPDQPGLGVAFDQAAAAAHPFTPRDLYDFHEPTFQPRPRSERGRRA
jgi:galactonate dehydratase